MSKIYDVAALRIIVSSVAECYQVLGIIHGMWRPLPGKIKDYIALPKPNGYQSIHTTVLTSEGVTEIQIRTRDMHRNAQYGIASHISYKEQSYGKRGSMGSNLQWLRQLLPHPFRLRTLTPEARPREYSTTEIPGWIREVARAHENTSGTEEYLASLKGDFFEHRIFIFTPNGDVIDLPVGSTPIDFAYAIHSDIGDHASGARINNKYSSLDTVLKNGDIVEVETRDSNKPSHKWLEFAKTTMARRHIRAALEREQT